MYSLCVEADGYGFIKGPPLHWQISPTDLQSLTCSVSSGLPRGPESLGGPVSRAFTQRLQLLSHALLSSETPSSSCKVHLRCHFFLSSPFRIDCCRYWHPQHFCFFSTSPILDPQPCLGPGHLLASTQDALRGCGPPRAPIRLLQQEPTHCPVDHWVPEDMNKWMVFS